MKGQPNQLAAKTAGPLAGSAIDHGRILQFRLDGRTINSFVGDTVLSAVLAASIDTIDRRADGPLALTSLVAPAIIAAPLAKDTQRAMTMERTLATNGADYVTLAPRRGLTAFDAARRLVTPITILGVDLRHADDMGQPWTGGVGAVETPADLIVVGGMVSPAYRQLWLVQMPG
ncbi:MAG: hypothetical protein MO846_01260 [Candidatus Devosia symbiotica]|nr:hypothetical protein [Candidatus Devosia symbiotica]